MAARLKKNKPRVNHEPRSAHGRADNSNKPRVNLEPRSVHGRAVKKEVRSKIEEDYRKKHPRRRFELTFENTWFHLHIFKT